MKCTNNNNNNKRFGFPRICKLVGGDKPFHDGGGAMFAWPMAHETRELAEGRNWDWLREATLNFAGGPAMLEKEAFRVAGGEEGCKLVKDGQLQKTVLKILSDWTTGPGFGHGRLARECPRQPFRLRLIATPGTQPGLGTQLLLG